MALCPHNSEHRITGMSDDPAKCRKLAEECRQQAARAISPTDKERWLRLSEDWLRRAQAPEHQLKE